MQHFEENKEINMFVFLATVMKKCAESTFTELCTLKH